MTCERCLLDATVLTVDEDVNVCPICVERGMRHSARRAAPTGRPSGSRGQYPVEVFRAAMERQGLSYGQVAVRLGWWHWTSNASGRRRWHVADGPRVRRYLGVRPDEGAYRAFLTEPVAIRMARAIDPHLILELDL
jgi:hypothetical protein